MSKIVNINRNKSSREMLDTLKELIADIPEDDLSSFMIAIKTKDNFGFASGIGGAITVPQGA